MSNPTIYTFNGKMARVGNGVLGSVPPEPIPEDCIKIGNTIWKKANVAGIQTTGGSYKTYDDGKYMYNLAGAQEVANSVEGYRLPTKAECEELMSAAGNDDASRFLALASTSGWTYGNGQNTLGLNFTPDGYYINSSRQGRGFESDIHCYDAVNGWRLFDVYKDNSYGTIVSIMEESEWIKPTYFYPVRLVKES